ncbi:MAG: hypothetical protein IPK13_16120 [Deltaproteobacteria bacterium]|nr:hypothetical protein [Deltaproteobacteria bacterium]
MSIVEHASRDEKPPQHESFWKIAGPTEDHFIVAKIDLDDAAIIVLESTPRNAIKPCAQLKNLIERDPSKVACDDQHPGPSIAFVRGHGCGRMIVEGRKARTNRLAEGASFNRKAMGHEGGRQRALQLGGRHAHLAVPSNFEGAPELTADRTFETRGTTGRDLCPRNRASGTGIGTSIGTGTGARPRCRIEAKLGDSRVEPRGSRGLSPALNRARHRSHELVGCERLLDDVGEDLSVLPVSRATMTEG